MIQGPLERRLSAHTPEAMQVRGRRYAQRRVRRVRVEGQGASAIVQGTLPYTVSIEIRDRATHVDCTCPSMARSGICKHVFALAVHLDASGQSAALLPAAQTEGLPGRVQADLGGAPWDQASPDAAPSTRGGESTPGGWRARLGWIQSQLAASEPPAAASPDKRVSHWEVVVYPETARGHPVELWRTPQRQDGTRGKRAHAHWDRLKTYSTMPAPIARALERVSIREDRSWYRDTTEPPYVDDENLGRVLAAAAAGVEVFLERGDPEERVGPLRHEGRTWQTTLRVHLDRKLQTLTAQASFSLPGGRVDVNEPITLVVPPSTVVVGDVILETHVDTGDAWATSLLEQGPLVAPLEHAAPLLETLAIKASKLPLELEGFETTASTPQGRLSLDAPESTGVPARVRFEYDGDLIEPRDPSRVLLLTTDGTARTRDLPAEQELMETLVEAGVERAAAGLAGTPWRVPLDEFPARLTTLIEAGWVIDLDGTKVRSGGSLQPVSIRSGVDWFELEGGAEFDGVQARLPAILAAARSGRQLVELEDGTHAVLPPAWRERLAALDRVTDEGSERVSRARALLLDDVLDAFGRVEADAEFTKTRKTLARFDGVSRRTVPRAFKGTLRPYQEEGLGWLDFLTTSGLGGCLADDMGLGKTVQVLAHLLHRKRHRKTAGPTLIVAPRSVIWNWHDEAKRFTPTLRTSVYHGPGRKQTLEDLDSLDAIITTYGTLRVDIDRFAEISFDHVVLDEAQAIKNPGSKAARAVRRLQASHRLALSGTPIENRLGDLASLFAFLAPGLLGGERELHQLLGGSRAKPSPKGLAQLQRALRPVILRRTKAEVLQDLPPKTEQTVLCELPEPQQKVYTRIRDHYRGALLTRVAERGLAQSKIQVLEALLRLRQAACHPALLDRTKADQATAKFNVLLPMLEELIAEGHKALIFSQFTKYLGLLRSELDEREIPYEYLDGRTRKRQERVDAFQEDPDTPLFLISLKAGGTGLNLTAADYVFLLDPWWNPAVEAQAIDRTHRIGQKRAVMVYRLIGAGTIEEKVLELQDRKRALVQSVLGGIADAPLRDLDVNDLKALLS